jgi:hypothetical protein
MTIYRFRDWEIEVDAAETGEVQCSRLSGCNVTGLTNVLSDLGGKQLALNRQ